LIQKTACVKHELLAETKDPVANAPEKALYPVLIEIKPGLPEMHGLDAWAVNWGFFCDNLIENIGNSFCFIMLVRNHEIRKEAAHRATVPVIAFAERDPVPYLFASVFFPDVTSYMGSVLKDPSHAFRTQALFGTVNDGLIVFGIANDFVFCYTGHGY
jgi:hypothetical protein